MTTWMLTGGAGYIGAHVLRALQQAGHDVVVLDDLSTGVEARIPDGVPLVRANVLDTAAVTQGLQDHGVSGVIHLAAKKAAGESVEKPLLYWRENAEGTRALLEAMVAAGTRSIVFSSSSSVYGEPETEDVAEDAPTRPVSPYGESKLVSEWMIRDAGVAHGIGWAALRYFNVAGAGEPVLGDTGIFNLVPLVFQAITTGGRPKVFGDDYDTRDGSCIRDYIHVVDLAEAHVAAATKLEQGTVDAAFNIGRGEGSTVKEVLGVVREVTGIEFEYDVVARRGGDPSRVVARPEKANAELGWTAQRDLRDMVASAWEAWQAR
ncbi:UDP-galactose 4-epimerase [Motilibacter rhizosphaerae]|uniref:UDP-glucose 4-epimerase n=1 Tax=Motilibacter rhizosphaerae TaxID=598652 RepID=A0A4Q7NUM9_9ACTN|nr:UDP-glucose 4-epimerase GalE [Motilibacter rhizosphaerae]RZS90825.1 UDP-galactose 4-epimerase [Motilibacter rhizosphaerae]